MEGDITGTIESVTGREVRSGTIFDVVIGGKKLSTFKAPVAEEAKALQGSEVTARVDVTEKNGYTNYTLLGVTLVNAGGSTPTMASGIPLAPATSPESRGGMSPEREAKIVRQSSMATAFNYAASAGLSEDEAFALAGRIYARAMGETAQPAQEPVAAAAPAEVSDSIPW